ncbi:TolC family outer membrane protein [Novosphingobium sp.]|uniref:TolC family outer membrane protein n=1 Tax=Novosphingobium sp. TaxID=1874826 RepID=UPI0031E1B894
MIRQRSIMVAGAALLAVAARPLHAQTLAEAIIEAYRTNPTLGASRYDVRQADEGVAQARAELRPTTQLQATAGYDHAVTGQSSRSPFSPSVTDSNSNQIQVSLVQPLYTSGKATADRHAAEAGVSAARASLRGVEGDLLLAVITAYADVRRYDAQLAVWRGSVGQLEKIEAEIAARREAGELTLTDVSQARNQLNQEREQAVATEQQLEGVRADYADLVGSEAGDLAPEPPLPRLPRSANEAFAEAETNSPDLARALFTERSSRANIDAMRSQGGPTVSLRGGAGLSGDVWPYRLRDQNRDVSGSVVLSMPLSAGGRIASQIRQAQDKNAQDRLQIEASRRNLMRDVRNAWNALATAQRALDLIEARRAAARIQLDGMLSEYRVGLRSTFDVLYAQQSLRDAELSVIGARRDRYIAGATLLRRAGDLDVETLVSGVEPYDPASHLRHVQRVDAMPWDAAVQAMDATKLRGHDTPPIILPPLADNPGILAPTTSPPDHPPLARSMPLTPRPATAGRVLSRDLP